MKENYLTREGYEKLFTKLEYLKKVKRKELSKAIGNAREQGDLSENAEYDAAKDAQALNEKRIFELEQKLTSSQIIDYKDIPSDKVLLGVTVKLKDLNTGEEIEYTLVTPEEVDFEQRKISVASPIAQGLLNHRVGDELEIKVPAGLLKYKILDIFRK